MNESTRAELKYATIVCFSAYQSAGFAENCEPQFLTNAITMKGNATSVSWWDSKEGAIEVVKKLGKEFNVPGFVEGEMVFNPFPKTEENG